MIYQYLLITLMMNDRIAFLTTLMPPTWFAPSPCLRTLLITPFGSVCSSESLRSIILFRYRESLSRHCFTVRRPGLAMTELDRAIILDH